MSSCGHCGQVVGRHLRTYNGVLFCGASCYRKVMINNHPMTGRAGGCPRCVRARTHEREHNP